MLLAAEGLTNVQIANTLGINSHTARKWRNRFAEQRMDGLEDETRSGRPRCIDDDAVAEVIRKTLEETPRDATHWSTRSMARATGYAPSTIHRMWQAFSLQPHRSETFKLSADPYFVDKVRDIVGLYMDPPQHALVLCVDEKSQVQGPRSAAAPARSATQDYKRNGTTSLFTTSPPGTVRTVPPAPDVPPGHIGQEFKLLLDEGDGRVRRAAAPVDVPFDRRLPAGRGRVGQRPPSPAVRLDARPGPPGSGASSRSTVACQPAAAASHPLRFASCIHATPRCWPRATGTNRPAPASPASSRSCRRHLNT